MLSIFIINTSISLSSVYIGSGYIGDKPMVYEQDEVADAIVMRHGFMEKKVTLLNPQIETDKPQIWQLVSSITIWYIWTAQCMKVFRNVTMNLPK